MKRGNIPSQPSDNLDDVRSPVKKKSKPKRQANVAKALDFPQAQSETVGEELVAENPKALDFPQAQSETVGEELVAENREALLLAGDDDQLNFSFGSINVNDDEDAERDASSKGSADEALALPFGLESEAPLGSVALEDLEIILVDGDDNADERTPWAKLDQTNLFENITIIKRHDDQGQPNTFLNPASSTPFKRNVEVNNNKIISQPMEAQNNDCFIVPAENPTNTTATNWSNENAVHALLNLIGINLPRLKRERNHNAIWNSISDGLLELGFKFTAEECRAKKRSLESSYHKLVKKGDSTKCGSWQFFEGMKYIVSTKDWPTGFVSMPASAPKSTTRTTTRTEPDFSEDFTEAAGTAFHHDETPVYEASTVFDDQGIDYTEVIPNQTPIKNKTAKKPDRSRYNEEGQRIVGWNWSKDDLALVQMYFEIKDTMPKHSRNDMVYFNVATALQSAEVPILMSMSEAKNRFSELQAMFRDKFDQQKLTGRGGFSDELYELFLAYQGEDDPALNAPVTVSAGSSGRSTLMTRCELNDSSTSSSSSSTSRYTKKRPPTNNRQQRAARLMGPSSDQPKGVIGYQNRALEIQQQKLVCEAQFVSEFSLYRRAQENREQKILEGLNTLKEIVEKRRSSSP